MSDKLKVQEDTLESIIPYYKGELEWRKKMVQFPHAESDVRVNYKHLEMLLKAVEGNTSV